MKELIKHFHRPLSDVAKDFDVCMTFMKKVCRGHGIVRWPYRKVTILPHLLALGDTYFFENLTTLRWSDPEPQGENVWRRGQH